MSISLHRVVSVVLLSAALTALGCKPPPSRVNFNNDMALANQSMGKAAVDFRKALYPQGKDFDPDNAKVQSARQAMAKALKAAQDDYEDAPLPRKSTAAGPLLEAYKKYLDVQKDIMVKIDKAVAVLADQKLSKGEKQSQVESLLSEIKAADDKAYTKVTDAQKAYTDAHFFRLVDKLE